MSRPKIGSATVWVGENGTRWIHSSSVSQTPVTAPAMPSASRTATPARTQVPIGTRSGMSSASNVKRQLAGPPDRAAGRPNGPNEPPVARSRALCSAWRWASASRPATS